MRAAVFWCLLFAGAAPFCAGGTGTDTAEPGGAAATATLHCIGIVWPVEGDSNGNTTCEVAYRKAGADQWQDALPLHRKPAVEVDVEKSMAGNRPIRFLGGISTWGENVRNYALEHWKANYLAGSIFNLEPATEYEVRLRLADPDGDAVLENILKVATRSAPVLAGGGAEIRVRASDGEGALAAAINSAAPGDTVLVHKGTYPGPVRITASGAPGKPIVVRPAGDGAAVIEGKGYRSEGSTVVEITGSHLHLHNLEIRGAITGVKIGSGRHADGTRWKFLTRRDDIPSDIAITRCTVSQVQHAIVGTGNDCYVADNELTGLAKDVKDIGWSEGEGVEITGSGTVVCHNRMRHLADGLSVYPNTCDQDVHNNDVSACSDDGIELDYCDYNNRIWNNRFNFAGHNGISLQPHIGGPGYIIRNQVIGFDENCIKDRYGSSDVYLYHNTFIGREGSEKRYPRPTELPWVVVSRNNIYLLGRGEGDPVISFHAHELEAPTFDLDYDGLGGPVQIRKAAKELEEEFPGSTMMPERRLFVPVDVFAGKFGVLKHRVMLNISGLFEVPLPPFRGWWEEGPEPVMRLKAGAPAVDAGVGIPNVNEDFTGAAPDLGALEFGVPEPVYGPRPPGAAPYERGEGSEGS